MRVGKYDPIDLRAPFFVHSLLAYLLRYSVSIRILTVQEVRGVGFIENLSKAEGNQTGGEGRINVVCGHHKFLGCRHGAPLL